jgi:hypothetical protein
MSIMLKKVINKTSGLLGHKRFFIFILVFFIFESTWIAFSALYPQAFDEDFHFGLIKIYSHYWLPFLSGQPKDSNAYGAVARDPSYLYHYLMSFPYRIIALFIRGQTGQVIVLRLINVGLVCSGLILFRRVLLRIGVSRSLSNIIFFLFILIPIVPQLAAQINYDNLLFPLVAWVCLLTFKLTDQIRDKRPSARTLITLLTTCLLTSLVKYAFLPIFLAVVIYLVAISYQRFRGELKNFSKLLYESFKTESKTAKTILIGLVLISVGLFIQRDGINIIKYHSIDPNCSTILNIKDCSSYSVWYYNYTSHQEVLSNPSLVSHNPIYYIGEWIYWMWYRLFFSVNGPQSEFTNYPPLPFPCAAAALIAIVGIGAVIKWRRQLLNKYPYIIFLFTVCAFYLTALLVQGYSSYKYTDVLQNMNGRYLLPILLLVVALAGLAFSIALRHFRNIRVVIAGLALVMFLQGGGFLTFITRGNGSWEWPNSTVVKVNNAAQKVINPVIVNGKETYTSKLWFFN